MGVTRDHTQSCLFTLRLRLAFACPPRLYELLLHISCHAVSQRLRSASMRRVFPSRKRSRPVAAAAPSLQRQEYSRLALACQARILVAARDFRHRARSILSMQEKWKAKAEQLRQSYAAAVAERVRVTPSWDGCLLVACVCWGGGGGGGGGGGLA